FKKYAGVPSVREVWRGFETESVFSGLYSRVVRQPPGRTNGSIVHENHGAYDTAYGLGPWRKGQPLIQRATLVWLKVTEAHILQGCRIDDACHSVTNHWKDLLHTGFE